MKKGVTMKVKSKDTQNRAHLANSRVDVFLRRLNWFFSKSGIIALAVEHFLAMLPATIFVPLHVNETIGKTVIDLSLVLFTSGVGTIIFNIRSKGKIPAYLGSSFAYIGLTVYLMQEQLNGGISPEYAYIYVGWAYIFSGIFLVLLSVLYRINDFDRIMSFFLPASVVGPAISLIGLELAGQAVLHSGFDLSNGLVDKNAALIAIVTFIVIILFSLIRHKIWKNAAIVIGIIVGYILSFAINGISEFQASAIEWFTFPRFNVPLFSLPPNLLNLALSVIPATFIVYTENIGRTTVINRMTEGENSTEGSLFSSSFVQALKTALFSHGVSSIAVTLIGSVPNTIYAENIAVMEIHKSQSKRDETDPYIQKMMNPYSTIPYFIAGGFAIIFSFLGILQHILTNIPVPVIGGMELFLFGIISAPGIQLLVEQRVNYKKISNQIITAAVLVSGIGGLSIQLGVVELKGMSLGFAVGVFLNLLIRLLKWIGNISDTVYYDEILLDSLSALSHETKLKILDVATHNTQESKTMKKLSIQQLISVLRNTSESVKIDGEVYFANYIREVINRTDSVTIGVKDNKEFQRMIIIRKTTNGLWVECCCEMLSDDIKIPYLNDYPDAIDENDGFLKINASKNIPWRKIRTLIKIVEYESEIER